MIQHDDRRRLLSRLSRQLAYTAPVLALAAGGVALQATADGMPDVGDLAEEGVLLASDTTEAAPEAEAEAEG